MVVLGRTPSQHSEGSRFKFQLDLAHIQSERVPTDRPSASLLLSRVIEVIQHEGKVLEGQLLRNDVEMIRGDASFRSPHTLGIVDEFTSQQITSDKFLIAVGTIPTPPPGVPTDGTMIINSDGVLSLKRLPKSMTVVGAGVIGMEYASMFAELGVEVTVVDSRECPLEFIDAEIVDELIHQMRNKNMAFRLSESVQQFEISSGPRTRAVVQLGSGKRLL